MPATFDQLMKKGFKSVTVTELLAHGDADSAETDALTFGARAALPVPSPTPSSSPPGHRRSHALKPDWRPA